MEVSLIVVEDVVLLASHDVDLGPRRKHVAPYPGDGLVEDLPDSRVGCRLG